MPGDLRKKSPRKAGGGRAGGETVVTPTLAPRRDACKPGPKSVHPLAEQLRNDRDFVWRRMLASVCPAEFFEDNDDAT